jgi:hypothetical protein
MVDRRGRNVGSGKGAVAVDPGIAAEFLSVARGSFSETTRLAVPTRCTRTAYVKEVRLMQTRRWCMALAMAGSGLVSLGCQINIPGTSNRATEDFDLSAPAEGITSLGVDWLNGEILVRVDPAVTDVEASGTKSARAFINESASDILDAIQIELAVDPADESKLLLTFDGPASGALIGADVEVLLPASLDLSITSTNGRIRVDDNAAATTVRLTNGDVMIDGQVGDTLVDVDNGDVDVNSENGDVDVDVDNGTAEIDADPPDGGSISVRSDVGNLRIRVPAGFAASLDLRVDVGNVDADLDGFVVTDLQQEFNSLSATLNGGGGSIVADVDLGTIAFDKLMD